MCLDLRLSGTVLQSANYDSDRPPSPSPARGWPRRNRRFTSAAPHSFVLRRYVRTLTQRGAKSRTIPGQFVKTGSSLAAMRRLFGGISDECLTVAVAAKKSPQSGVAPGTSIARHASSPRGATEEVLVLGHGFSRDMLAMLVLAGLAKVVSETVRAGGSTIKVERVSITDAGRRAIDD